MRKVNFEKRRMSTAILYFAVAIVVTSLVAGAWLYVYINEQSRSDKSIYVFSPEESVGMFQGNEVLTVKSDRIISASSYQKGYLQKISRITPALFLLLSAVLIAVLFFIWRYMMYLERKKLEIISEQIVSASEGTVRTSEPILEKVYQKLKNDFENQLNDYKKLTAYLSHEQKNELAILRSRLELSREEGALKNVDSIIENIDDIITLSETKAGTGENIDVALICAEICDKYRVFAEIDFDFEEDQSTVIRGKYRWIYRAIANLVDNAVKYGNHQPVSVRVYVKHASVIVLVKDRGIGISQKEQLSIFNNAYRVNDLKRDGYGIGLSVVAHVCNLCGGFVALESELGSGSSFYLSFPQENSEM